VRPAVPFGTIAGLEVKNPDAPAATRIMEW